MLIMLIFYINFIMLYKLRILLFHLNYKFQIKYT